MKRQPRKRLIRDRSHPLIKAPAMIFASATVLAPNAARCSIISKYLVNANRTLQGATSAADVQSDQEATKLMTEAAVRCGEVVP